MGKPIFRTRIDELNSSDARFYFSHPDDAEAFSVYHGASVVQTSPVTAGGGLWCVTVPYTTDAVEITATVVGAEFSAAIDAAIEAGRGVLAQAVQS